MAGVNGTAVLHYPSRKYPFTSAVCSLLGVTDLPLLHEHFSAGDTEADQETPAHRRFYAGFAGSLAELYGAFLTGQVARMWDEPLAVQRVPTFRVAMPGSTAVREYHTDGDYRHQQGTVNFWVPLTDAYDTNTIWLESEPGRGDYKPVTMEPGEMLRFDGVNLRHGNEKNDTGRTRVSFDFRVIPLSAYQPTGARTVHTGTPLTLGAYYGLLQDGRWYG